MEFDFETFGTTKTPTKNTAISNTNDGFDFENWGAKQQAPKKEGFLRKYVFPSTAEFTDYVGAGLFTLSKEGKMEGEEVIRISNEITKALEEKRNNPQQKDLWDKQISQYRTRLDDLTKGINERAEKMNKTASQMAGIALGTGVELAGVADILSVFSKPFLKKIPTTKQPSFSSLTPSKKAKVILKETAKIYPETLAFGYGLDVSEKLKEGLPVKDAIKPGEITLLSAFLPAGIAGLRLGAIPFSRVIKSIKSFGTPTKEMIKTEQEALENAYDEVFKQRENTYLKDDFLRKQGKHPKETLAKYGLMPDTEYLNGKTLMNTNTATEEASELISKRMNAIQKSLDNIEASSPIEQVQKNLYEMEKEALVNAKSIFSGQELTEKLNKIRKIFAGMRTKYGQDIGLGNINRERIVSNDLTKAFNTPQIDQDAFLVVGNILRKAIDDMSNSDLIRQINQEIGEIGSARIMLRKLNGKNIGGGRFTNIIASSAGAILGQMAAKDAGIFNQAIYAVASMMGVRLFLKMLAGNQFGGNATKRILVHLAENTTLLNKLLEAEPELIRKNFIKEIQRKVEELKLLPTGVRGTPSKIESGKPIPIFPKGKQIDYVGKDVVVGSQSPTLSNADATTIQMTNKTNKPISSIIPQIKK